MIFDQHPSQLGKRKSYSREFLYADDVLFYWAIVSAGWEIWGSQVLLEQIIEHYVTVRSFSFASSWIEKYKQANKKMIQKSEGVRKQLLAPPPKDHDV